MAGKAQRLGKAAGELNVGVSTIVEFLNSKGVSIDMNPNSKLEPEQYEMLRTQFAADQNLKEQSKLSAVKREKRETITLRDVKTEDTVAEDDDDFDANVLERVKTQPVTAPKPVAETPAPEAKEIVPETPKAAEPEVVAPTPAPVAEEPAAESSDLGDANAGPQVIGKIDLDKLNTRTRPDKRKKEDGPIDKSDYPTTATPDAAPEPAKAEKEEKPTPNPDAPKEIETIRVETRKLSGPTVLGKIELPVERPKSVGSSRPGDDRKKRKRIKKELPAKPGTPGQATAGPGNQNRPGGGPGGPNRPGGGPGGPNKGNNFSKSRFDKPAVSEQDIQKEIKDTLARLSSTGGKSKSSKNRRAKRDYLSQRREMEQAAAEMAESILKLTEFVTVSELASMMNVSPTQVISACMSLGIFASINQRLDAETIQIVAEEFGFETEFVSADLQEAIPEVEDREEDLIERPPIITVMGHVDHGKTSLLDKIRNANVTEGEAGGITQHIGAYSVTLKDQRKMTFLDTPGHEAFTAMRARGAQVTDVAIIIVAADDDVMPQTKEAISHAQAANVPMVFAINKIDKPGANPDKIREQLSAMNILVEEWGGKYQCQEISAKQNLNIDALLDKVLLEAELLALRANPSKNAVGTVIESSLDKGKGYVTNMLVQAGTMKVGDIILVGRNYGRVRAMHDEHGVILKTAGPSQPVSVLGINGAPSAGDTFHIMDDEREAKAIASKREQLYREQGLRTTKHITLDEIGRRLAIGDFKELNLIVKGDVDGSIEALSDSLLRLSTEQIQVNIVHKGVGAITEADVNLASASDAIIVGFQVRPSVPARKLAEQEQIDIRLYSVIYKAIDELKAAMEGMLSPDIEEKVIGTAEIRETFDITKVGTIAGCYVMDGLIKRSSKIRVIRDGIVIHSGTLGSLKRFKDDVKEVKNNYECGLNIDKFNDIKVGDIVEAYEEVEVARKL
ncbi:MAG: translation initiation factor IF-2 [Candidatus Fluviicola riflensis]|nr:MAG: translation initiation factor IF-2 [Candidatus Fluviicola riflensis]OGS78315.1 MAG: translation initiation factor IF-2 [Candidatus Fluviicola riflensis]OGS85381.1 MAG: translation initiation factor IF-2 [Fluviicola sp. RIFCSPHIGHO2_01_FULL_43_53]OGS87423.1 MAG: translation initiation factor IF-2 [Fluviicola sp. RIFCSPHIGHO2_12_FULL_43_24]